MLGRAAEQTRVPAGSSRCGCSALSTVHTHLPLSRQHPKTAGREGHCTDAHSPQGPPGRGCRRGGEHKATNHREDQSVRNEYSASVYQLQRNNFNV